MAIDSYITVSDAVQSALKDRNERTIGIVVDHNLPHSLDELTAAFKKEGLQAVEFSPNDHPSNSEFYLLNANLIRLAPARSEQTPKVENGYTIRDITHQARLSYEKDPDLVFVVTYNGVKPEQLCAALAETGISLTSLPKDQFKPDPNKRYYTIDVTAMSLVE
ncbi:hypothetical protein HYT52_02435 [Candidatus Woesearchaeota archaeon]|nr:hypothetical protein [Candidatus Woesearchaeota archaeon]